MFGGKNPQMQEKRDGLKGEPQVSYWWCWVHSGGIY